MNDCNNRSTTNLEATESSGIFNNVTCNQEDVVYIKNWYVFNTYLGNINYHCQYIGTVYTYKYYPKR